MTATSTLSHHHASSRDDTLLWAIAISLALHLLMLWQVPPIKFDQPPPPATLVVELAQPKPAAPAPAPTPEPTPEPEPTPTPPPPKPVVKQKPLPVKPTEAPARTQALPQPQESPPPQTESSAPPVITAAPKAEVAPTVTAPPPPPPEPPKPAGPSQQDIDAARNQYGNMLAREIAKYKQYPRIAQMRNWQGEAMLELQLDANGNLVSSRIHQSSGFEVLDKQALEMVKKASPFPRPPEALRGRSFTIQVPVSFRLEDA